MGIEGGSFIPEEAIKDFITTPGEGADFAVSAHHGKKDRKSRRSGGQHRGGGDSKESDIQKFYDELSSRPESGLRKKLLGESEGTIEADGQEDKDGLTTDPEATPVGPDDNQGQESGQEKPKRTLKERLERQAILARAEAAQTGQEFADLINELNKGDDDLEFAILDSAVKKGFIGKGEQPGSYVTIGSEGDLIRSASEAWTKRKKEQPKEAETKAGDAEDTVQDQVGENLADTEEAPHAKQDAKESGKKIRESVVARKIESATTGEELVKLLNGLTAEEGELAKQILEAGVQRGFLEKGPKGGYKATGPEGEAINKANKDRILGESKLRAKSETPNGPRQQTEAPKVSEVDMNSLLHDLNPNIDRLLVSMDRAVDMGIVEIGPFGNHVPVGENGQRFMDAYRAQFRRHEESSTVEEVLFAGDEREEWRNLKGQLNRVDSRLRDLRGRIKGSLNDGELDDGETEANRRLLELEAERNSILDRLADVDAEVARKKQEKKEAEEAAKFEEFIANLGTVHEGAPRKRLAKALESQNLVDLIKSAPTPEVIEAVRQQIAEGRLVYKDGKLEVRQFEGTDIESTAGREFADSVRQKVLERVNEEIKKEEQDPIAVEKRVEEFMVEQGVGKAMATKVRELAAVRKPPKRGVFSRIYLFCAEPELYEKDKEAKIKYKESQRELAEIKVIGRNWAKAEAALLVECQNHEARLTELTAKAASGEITKKEWREMEKIANKLAIKRESINERYCRDLAAKVGYEGDLPSAADWKGPEVGEKFTKSEREAKSHIVEHLKANKDYLGLSPEYQHLFLRQEAGGALRDLAMAKATRIHLTKKINDYLATGEFQNNPSLLLQLTTALRAAEMEERTFEKALSASLKAYSFKESNDRLGKQIKTSLKKTFGSTIAKVDPDFEVTFDTALSDILKNGDSKMAKLYGVHVEHSSAVKAICNRTGWGMLFVRKSFNEFLSNRIPESSKLSQKVMELDDRMADLDEKREEYMGLIEEVNIIKAGRQSKEFHRLEKESALRRDVVLRLIDEISPNPNTARSYRELYEKGNVLSKEFVEHLTTLLESQIKSINDQKERVSKERTELEHQKVEFERQFAAAELGAANNSQAALEAQFGTLEEDIARRERAVTAREELIQKSIKEDIKKLSKLMEERLQKKLQKALT